MIDSVLNGTGNSRFLKSAVPAGTSWADALAMLQAGTFPIDFNGINTEGFQQVGTPLNKANLLKDATAAQIGLPPSTTPDGMFQALGNTGELHVWRKTVTSGTGTYSLGAVQEGLHYIKWANNSDTSDSSGTFEYGSEIAVNNDGTITGIKNPSTITIKPWDDDASKANVFKGKFIKMVSQVVTGLSRFEIGEIWWIPADAVMTRDLLNGQSNAWYIAASKRQQVIGIPAGTTTTYPVSTNPNAYQEGDGAKEAGYVVLEVVTGQFKMSERYPTDGYYYKYASSISVADDGTISLNSPSQISFDRYNGGQSYANSCLAEIAGKFMYLSNRDSGTNAPDSKPPFNSVPSGVVHIPSDATLTWTEGGALDGFILSRYQPVTGYAAIPAGTTIEYLGKLGDKARVQVVSYVGTGTYGSSNPNSVTANFPIKLLAVLAKTLKNSNGNFSYRIDYNNQYKEDPFMVGAILTTNYTIGSGCGYKEDIYNTAYGKKSEDGKTFSWYTTGSNSARQFNESGYTYIVLLIG